MTPRDVAAILEHEMTSLSMSNWTYWEDLGWQGGKNGKILDPSLASLPLSLLMSEINNSLACLATVHQMLCYQQPNPLLPGIINTGSIKSSHFFS